MIICSQKVEWDGDKETLKRNAKWEEVSCLPTALLFTNIPILPADPRLQILVSLVNGKDIVEPF